MLPELRLMCNQLLKPVESCLGLSGLWLQQKEIKQSEDQPNCLVVGEGYIQGCMLCATINET
jgi:hypothetical protein